MTSTRESNESVLTRLRRQAELALKTARGRKQLEPVLDRLLHAAPAGTEASLFAHRHLAELRLERDPWRAALHLKNVIAHRGEDDVVQALMGLCQALLGNFRAAATAYKKALALAPRNPWYHHNLGHLLDVAVGAPKEALAHLRAAHKFEPLEHEITASLAHCLAILGQLDEAKLLAAEALNQAPESREHKALLDWILRGAKTLDEPQKSSDRTADDVKSGRTAKQTPPKGEKSATSPRAKPSEEKRVLDAVGAGMTVAGYSSHQIDKAREMWRDFHGAGRSSKRAQKPEAYAAALEYAIAKLSGAPGVTQVAIAKRYGVAQSSLRQRYDEIRETLGLALR